MELRLTESVVWRQKWKTCRRSRRRSRLLRRESDKSNDVENKKKKRNELEEIKPGWAADLSRQLDGSGTIQTQDTTFQALQPRSEFKSLGPITFSTSRRAAWSNHSSHSSWVKVHTFYGPQRGRTGSFKVQEVKPFWPRNQEVNQEARKMWASLGPASSPIIHLYSRNWGPFFWVHSNFNSSNRNPICTFIILSFLFSFLTPTSVTFLWHNRGRRREMPSSRLTTFQRY